MVCGLTLNEGISSLAKIYLAALQAVSYGTRHIIETLNQHGYKIHMCGGGTKNPLWLREHANVTGCKVKLPREPEAVLLGDAILAATAAGTYETVEQAIENMSAMDKVIEPDEETKAFHDKKYQVFLRMYDDQIAYNAIME